VNKGADLGLKTKVEMDLDLFGCELQVGEIENEVGSVCGYVLLVQRLKYWWIVNDGEAERIMIKCVSQAL